MYLYIELWSPKEAWLRLPDEKRRAMIDQLLAEARENPITGVVPVSVKRVGDRILFDGVRETPAVVDPAVARPTGFRYVAAWMVPSLELIEKFEQRVESLGWWFEYFDQENAWGEMNAEAVLGEMSSPPGVALKRPKSTAAGTGTSAPASRPAEAPGSRASGGDEFDYVIVGAGSAGCVIANRLSEDPNVSVLVLEAGGPELDPGLDEIQLMGSELDWSFLTEPEPKLRNRRLVWPRGKALGGSSAIAGRTYVRGNRLDFDAWKTLGNEGWGHDEVLPYFKRLETNTRFRGPLHGTDGPLRVESIPGGSALKTAFLEAAAACGFGADPDWDFNGETQEGVAGYYQYVQKDDRRLSAAAAYLTPVAGRSNLTVRDRCLTQRILWDRNRAVGVEYAGTDWQVRTARARREVILCAGAVGSPQILMLSGVGPARHLRSLNVPIKADLPGVGQNLQDHLQISLSFRPNASAGRVGHLGGTNGLFVRSRHCASSSSPDLQVFGVEALVPEKVLELEPGPTYLMTACLVTPYSRGSVSLASGNPLAKPLIHAGYLEDARDLAVLVEGVELIRRLAGAAPLARLLERELVPGPEYRGHNMVTEAVRERAGSNFHPVGTCKMGIDHRAVVDPQLRVRGFQGLRVADASVMPRIVNGNTNAATVMIGEKAADLIKKGGEA